MSEIIQQLALFSFLVPLAAAVWAVVARGSRASTFIQWLLIAGAASGLGAVACFFFAGYAGSGVALMLPGGFGALFEMHTLSALFLGIICTGAGLASVYALGYLPRYADEYPGGWVNAATALFIFGMIGTVLSSTVFGFLLFWEVMSVAAYFLVITDRSADSLQAGFLYFLMTHLGFAALVAGFGLLGGGAFYGTFGDLATHAATLEPGVLTVAFLLLFAGFGSKAGLVPLHQWLPYAHPQAPSHSSALMSGVMLKVALFGFIQTLFLFPSIPLTWAATVMVVGLVSAFFGVLYAVTESDIKRLLAWSSIENMGLIFSAIGAVGVVYALPLGGEADILARGALIFILLHTLNHFLFKTGLFLAAGAIVSGTHTRDLDALGGLARPWPLFAAATLALSLTAAALPPFGAFFGEWAYIQALATALTSSSVAVSFGAAAALSIVALVGGLAIATFVKLFAATFLGRGRSEAVADVPLLPFTMLLPIGVCAVLSLGMGAMAGSIVSFFERAAFGVRPLFTLPSATLDPLAAYGAIVFVPIFLYALYRLLAPQRSRSTDTWDCGQPLTRRMEYTATGFAAPIRFFFRALLLSEKRLTTLPVSAENPWVAEHALEWHLTSVWERSLYRPIGKAVVWSASMVSRLQNGNVQFYLFLVLGALIVVIWSAV
ncbi:MAG: proton-conducting transporter membrane subunit [Patescibacteria group bacterium]|mgnify:CR=1 FL=1